jgi:DNA-binding MarR family transcriptional regulator
VDRLLELTPSIRRAFEVRLSEERAQWLALTGHQLEALAALKEGSLTMRSLCERLDISESAGTALSDRLVARGMVARETDPADRRVVRLALTDEARRMVQRYRRLKSGHAAQLLSTLSQDDLERLVQIYETLVAAPSSAAPSSAVAAPSSAAPSSAVAAPSSAAPSSADPRAAAPKASEAGKVR